MSWHFHKWGKWETILMAKAKPSSVELGWEAPDQIHSQRRSCTVCNFVQVRRP